MRNATLRKSLISGLVIVNIALWQAVFYWEAHRFPTVTFFDVGQGDAILIQAPGGNQVLIDGGSGSAILRQLGHELPWWDRSIDAVILTHPHADHLAGLIEVLGRYRISSIIESGADHTTPEFIEWQNVIRKNHIPVISARAGQRIDLGGGVYLEVLFPLAPAEGFFKNPHDASVIARFFYGSTTVLLTGDAESKVEKVIVERGLRARGIDVLKVGHHGSRTSSSDYFLEAFSPEAAIISSGKNNRYGHPHADILERFKEWNIPLFRTDVHGTIRLTTDGKKISIVPER